MRNQTLAWAVVFVEHGLPFHFYAEEWEARAVCNAINSGDTGDTDYGECRVVPLCEARMEYDAEHRQEDNIQPESAYVALRNMSVRLKTPTMNGYPEIGDIKHVMEEAVMEWSRDRRKIVDLEERLKND